MTALKQPTPDPDDVDSARNVLCQCLAIESEESLLVVCDSESRPVADCFHAAARQLTSHTNIVEMAPRNRHGEEPPPDVAAAMKDTDVALLVTSKSLSHTAARRAATEAGVRLASMPGVTRHMLSLGGLTADYGEVAALTGRVSSILSGVDDVRITTAAGTDLTLAITGRPLFADTGLYHEPGSWGNLPAGEVCLAPVEGVGEGTLVVDGAMMDALAEPVSIEVKAGRAVSIRGGSQAERIEATLASEGADGFVVAEFGIGTNPAARLIGNVLEDEKVLGTIHVAFGNNVSFGGENDVAVHIDGIVCEPTVTLDGAVLLDKGVLQGAD